MGRAGGFLWPLSEGKSELFNRTQCSQRGFLRLGESFHSGDNEPFVGPITPQGPQQLAPFQVPYLDGPVIAATGQSTAIGTDSERLDCPLMPLTHPHMLPALYVP